MEQKSLGPYEILEPLGAGGMGEVYGAHDPNLKRDVAIKVLPAELAADPDRPARLKHPVAPGEPIVMSIVRGVDGCKRGWICVSLDLNTGKTSAQVAETAEALFDGDESAVTGIDILLGLPEVHISRWVLVLSECEASTHRS